MSCWCLCSPPEALLLNTDAHQKQFSTGKFRRDHCFFVMVRAGTAYRKIWRLVNNFFARIIRFTVQKFQLFWVIFCIIIFFHWIMAHFNFVISQNGKWGMPVFTLIATRWQYRKLFFYKKALTRSNCRQCRVEGSRDVNEQKLVLQRVPGKQTAKYTVIYQSKTPSDLWP